MATGSGAPEDLAGENRARRADDAGGGDHGIDGDHLPTGLHDDDDVATAFHDAVAVARDRASRDYLVALMRHYHGNVTHAATRAGLTRESLHRLLKKYGVRTGTFRTGDH